MITLLTRLIFVYQGVSRFFLPKACRFHPSCSNYAIEAIRKHGSMRGLGLAFMRICRCSPLTKGGYDPVR
ncbi:MAG: membrane protein insertion efficiency factor YidD [Candidatus Omnitrophica bacterium]|nr:membrane protein insertion efficiency factor YidD [Candidatus Omnitrophota bacterium]